MQNGVVVVVVAGGGGGAVVVGGGGSGGGGVMSKVRLTPRGELNCTCLDIYYMIIACQVSLTAINLQKRNINCSSKAVLHIYTVHSNMHGKKEENKRSITSETRCFLHQ